MYTYWVIRNKQGYLELGLGQRWSTFEPGTPISWQGMYSPWHLNTDSYRLTFDDFLPTYVER